MHKNARFGGALFILATMICLSCEDFDEDFLEDFEEDTMEVRAGSGDGLKAVYFNNLNFTTQALQRVDSTIDFDWGRNSPHSRVDNDTFSVRWTGFVQPRYSGTYTFYTVSDDGARLWVNNRRIIEDWNDHGAKENRATISLEAGQSYAIKMEYYDNDRGAVVRLLWSSSRQAKQVIPRSQLFTKLVVDECPNDPNKTKPGECGCGVPEGDCPTGEGLYEAERRTMASGCTQNSNHAGYTGAGFMDFGGQNSWIEWNNINALSAGAHNLVLRYANGGSTRPVAIIVNGQNSGTVGFENTGGWTRWKTDRIEVSLRRGNNTIRVVASTSAGGPNLDNMTVKQGDATRLCAQANENKKATLSCPNGKKISRIDFASYGLPSGTCNAGFQVGTCHASSSKSKVESACLNRQWCTVPASNGTFGDPCKGTSKRLAVAFACSGDDGNDQCPNDPNKTAPGECGCGVPEGTCDPGGNDVLPSDTVLVRPDNRGPIIAPITAYTWRKSKVWPDRNYELPIYKTNILDRETDDYWNYLVDELLLARVDVVLLHGRGCTDLNSGYAGNGSLCPRWLTRFLDAVKRADAEDVLKVGMFDPMDHYLYDHPGSGKFDLSKTSNWKYFWDHNIKILFDIFPEQMLYRLDGKPIIATWHLDDSIFTRQQGNASRLLSWLENKFRSRYDLTPAFIIQDKWFRADSTINGNHAEGKHSWFSPTRGVLHSYTSFNGKTWGVVGPGYRKIEGGVANANSEPGCGKICREVLRRNGQTAIEGFEKGKNARLILLEGWTNISENNGFYRSDDWQYPNHYINIVRRYADPEPETLRFQAEAADRFYDKTSGNTGNHYRNGNLDIGRLNDRSGWYVGWIQAGEWLEFENVELGCGTYRFTARVATNGDNKKIRLNLGGLPSVRIPNTGSMAKYQLVHLGEIKLKAGTYDLRVVFESTNVNLDWFFLKKRSANCS